MELNAFFLDKGKSEPSATRLAFLLWAIGVLIVWACVSLATKSLLALPESVVTILGILMGGKAVQRFGEK
jgi:hypothetical protein